MSDDYVYQLSISIPHSGSDYSKADMVNIRGRNPDEFHRALTAFNEHMSQQCVEVGAMLRAHTLLKDGLGAQQIGQERHENPQNGAQGAPSGQVDPWSGQPANGAQNGSQWQAPQGGGQGGPPDWATQGQQQQQQQQQQAPAQDASGIPTTPPPHVGPAPQCSHGTKKFLAKPYKSGKPGYWMGWACPAQRNDPTQHDLEFIRTN